MQFLININVDNEAFEDRNEEVASILRNVWKRVVAGEADQGLHQNILDRNGNVVGTFVYVASAKIQSERAYEL